MDVLVNDLMSSSSVQGQCSQAMYPGPVAGTFSWHCK